MKAFITAHALTRGIIEVEGCITQASPSVFRAEPAAGVFNSPTFFLGEGKEWHRTREAAVNRAQVMRLNKMASLRKQLNKIQDLKFE